MITTTLKLTGTLDVRLYNESGDLLEHKQVTNLIVDAGKNLVAERLKDDTPVAPSHMAVGTDATAASVGQTALVAEAARVALTSSTVVSNAVSYIATFGAGTGTGTLVEAGLFNDPTAGTMLSRVANLNVVKSSSDTLTITWTITVS